MDLKLEIVSQQRHSAPFPISHRFGQAGGYIGRSEKCQWVLPDRTRRISRKHALIYYENEGFFLDDLSTNGVRLSLGHKRLVKGKPHRIEHGEGFIIGEYLIMARLLHDPGAYAAAAPEADLLALGQDTPLLDPLQAMDQEEELIARRRTGDFDDLLGQRTVLSVPSDHNDPRISTLQPVHAIPQDQLPIPEDWDREPETRDLPASRLQVTHPAEEALWYEPEKIQVPETDLFFRTLGLAEAPDEPAERERIMRLAAQLLVSAVEGMTRALQDRAECKNELRLPSNTTNLALKNNPLKFSPTPEDALAMLLKPPRKGILPAPLAMRQGFDDLHSHHLGLVAGARAAVRAALDKVSPQAVAERLDGNGPVRLRRTVRLWRTFGRLHQACLDDPACLPTLYLLDFTRAYQAQVQTLNPSTSRVPQGESS